MVKNRKNVWFAKKKFDRIDFWFVCISVTKQEKFETSNLNLQTKEYQRRNPFDWSDFPFLSIGFKLKS